MVRLKRLDITQMSVVDSIKGFFSPSGDAPGGAVHRRINKRAVWRLRQAGFIEQADWFAARLPHMACGSAWSDGRMRNLRHFYHPGRERGIFHLPDAEELAQTYCKWAMEHPSEQKSAFYLGAALHLVQDLTIPQHAGLKLLGGHHQYENYVRSVYLGRIPPPAEAELTTREIGDAVRTNSWQAFMVGRAFARQPEKERFDSFIDRLLPLAEISTAECMLWFYDAAVAGK